MSNRPRLKQSPLLRLGATAPDLPIDEITIPPGLLWQNMDTQPVLILACLFYEIRRIPQANEQLVVCYEHWYNTIFNKVKLMRKIGGEAPHPDEKGQINMEPVIDKIKNQCGFDESDVDNDLDKALGAWVRQWACGSKSMMNCIHLYWLFVTGTEEMYNKHRRLSKRVIRKAQQPNSGFKQSFSQGIDKIAGEQAKFWRVLMSPELKRCDGAARDEARRSVRENGFNLMYEKNLMRAVWCFVQYECLGKRIEDIAIEAEERNISLPLKTLYDDRNIDKYFQPFYEALALYGPITKRARDKVRIDYPVEANPEKSGKIASQVHQNLP